MLTINPDVITKKVRCENCDAVIDAEESRYFMTGKWYTGYRCYKCNSLRTVPTNEPYRLPIWERAALIYE